MLKISKTTIVRTLYFCREVAYGKMHILEVLLFAIFQMILKHVFANCWINHQHTISSKLLLFWFAESDLLSWLFCFIGWLKIFPDTPVPFLSPLTMKFLISTGELSTLPLFFLPMFLLTPNIFFLPSYLLISCMFLWLGHL